MKKYKVGILGATGTVGQKFAYLLREHPWFEIKVLAASERSCGKTFREILEQKSIKNIDKNFDENILNMCIMDVKKDAKQIASNVDFVFCALGLSKNEIEELEEIYAKLECPVISNNSAHRNTPDVPMVIPEINPEHIEIISAQKKRLNTKRGFIAVKSNCSIQCYVPALHVLRENYGLKSVLVCTYQAISGAGKNFDTWPEMCDNIIPYIAGEEEKSEQEPLKIWGKIHNNTIVNTKNLDITSQCLRVPVTDGHTAAVFAKFEKFKKSVNNIDNIINLWNNFVPDIQNLDLPSSPKRFLNYYYENNRPQISLDKNLHNGMGISIGRLRFDTQYDIKFVCMSHNTVRGAAGGAILLAELLCKKKYI